MAPERRPYRANMSTADFAHGEVVEVDPELFAAEIAAGMLTPLDGDGIINAPIYDEADDD